MKKIKFPQLIILALIIILTSPMPTHAVTHEYDYLGRLIQINYPDSGLVTVFTYDTDGNIIDTTTGMPSSPNITDYNAPNGITGAVYSFQFRASGIPVSVWSHTGNLPEGLTLSPTGLLSGTPTKHGRYTFTVTASNGTSPNASQAVTMQIFDPTLTVTTTFANPGDTVQISVRLERNPGFSTMKLRLNLPKGLTLEEYSTHEDLKNVFNEINIDNVNTHNDTGRLIEVKDCTGKTTFTLDLLGRILSVTDSNDRTVSHEYDKAGNQTHIHYPGGTEVARTFDELGRIKAIQTPEGIFNYTHDPVGRVLSVAMPNGITETYEHDKIGQLLSITQRNTNSNTSEVLNRNTYDPGRKCNKPHRQL